jgi:hypothetical protein
MKSDLAWTAKLKPTEKKNLKYYYYETLKLALPPLPTPKRFFLCQAHYHFTTLNVKKMGPLQF